MFKYTASRSLETAVLLILYLLNQGKHELGAKYFNSEKFLSKMISRLFPNRRECLQGLKNTEIIRKTLTKIFEKAQWFFRLYFYYNNTPPPIRLKKVLSLKMKFLFCIDLIFPDSVKNLCDFFRKLNFLSKSNCKENDFF